MTSTGKFRGTTDEQILWVNRKLCSLLDRWGDRIGLTVIEDHAYGKATANSTGVHELHGVVKNSLLVRGIPHITQSPQTIKKFATGNGLADKLDMIAHAKSYFPSVYNDDEADALHCARRAHFLLTGPELRVV